MCTNIVILNKLSVFFLVRGHMIIALFYIVIFNNFMLILVFYILVDMCITYMFLAQLFLTALSAFWCFVLVSYFYNSHLLVFLSALQCQFVLVMLTHYNILLVLPQLQVLSIVYLRFVKLDYNVALLESDAFFLVNKKTLE